MDMLNEARHQRRPVRALACAGLCMALSSCQSARNLHAASAAPVTHLYVASTGSDANPGTEAAPFLTIARADAWAVPGTTIHVAPGTYRYLAVSPQSAGIRTSRSGTAAARIRFVSSIKWGAKIVIAGTGITWKSLGSHVDIEGFDISGTGRHGILASGNNLTIRDNLIHDLTVSGGCTGAGGAAIDADGDIGNVLIHANTVRNIGRAMMGACNTVHGIYIASANNTVTNNIVSGVAAAGIQQWHGATASRISNNTVFHCKVGILIGQGDAGATPAGSEHNLVSNNIVYDNLTYGIVEGGKVGANNRYVNNLVHASGKPMQVAGAVSGTLSGDPLFRHYRTDGTGDYRVHPASPALRRGARRDGPRYIGALAN